MRRRPRESSAARGAGSASPLPGPVFRTPRLSLHPFELDDAPFVVELLNDPGFLRFVGDRGVRTVDDARRYLEEGPMAMQERLGHALWLVRLRADGTKIGMCGLLRRDGLDDVDIGFAFLPAFRRRGLATEAARATLEHGFGTLGLDRIVAITDPDNERSARLLETIGLRPDGTVTLPGASGPSRLFSAKPPGRKGRG